MLSHYVCVSKVTMSRFIFQSRGELAPFGYIRITKQSPRQEVSLFVDSFGNIPLSILTLELFPGTVWQKNYLVWLITRSRTILTTLCCGHSSSNAWTHALALKTV